MHVVNTTGSAIDVPLTGTSVGDLYGGQRSGWTNVPASSERVFAPSDPANTALPTVTGSVATVGGTLTATTGTWSGTPTIGLTLQWQRCNIQGAACESIAGATATTYTTQAADKDKRLRVVVSAANWISSYSQAQSAVTEVVEPTIAPANTERPRSAEPQPSARADLLAGHLDRQPGADLRLPVEARWREHCRRDGQHLYRRGGRRRPCADLHRYGYQRRWLGVATSNSLRHEPTANTGAPRSRTARVRRDCSQAPGPAARRRRTRTSGSGRGNIAGATASTYLLVAGDVGQAIKCTVTATNSQGSASASNSVVPTRADRPACPAYR